MTSHHHPSRSDIDPIEDAGGLRALIHGSPKLAIGLGAAIIVLVTLIAYVPAMKASFIWDDDYYVINNTFLRNWDGLEKIWFDVLPHPSQYPLPQYYPMTFTSFWLEFRIWGLNPTGYHVTNIILHICNAMLIWLLLRKLSVPGGWLAAVLFAVHPINVESVAWISERKNVLSVLFFLGSLYTYLRYAGIIAGKATIEPPLRTHLPAGGEDDEPLERMEWFTLPDDPQRLYFLSLVLFACAIFSKTITSSMPAIALLLIWWKRGRLRIKDLVPLLPLFVMGLGIGMLTAEMERWRVGVAMRPEAWDYAPTAAGEFGARCIIAGHAFWFYIFKLIWPVPLIFNYPRWTIDPSNAAQYMFPITAAVALLALFVLRKQLGRGVFAAAMFYAITLFPAMGFVDVWPMQYSFVADHFSYLSNIGLFVLFAAIVARSFKLEVAAAVAGVLVPVFMVASVTHARIFDDVRSLWEDTLNRTNNKSWMASNNYGLLLLQNGMLDSAEKWFKHVIAVKPDHPESRYNLARIEEIRGWMQVNDQRARAATQPTTGPGTAGALPTSREALSVDINVIAPGTQPTTTQSVAVASNEHFDKAIDWYRKAIEVQPNYVDAHYALGQLLLELGHTDQAQKQFEICTQIYPRHEMAHLALGDLAINRKSSEVEQRDKDLTEAYRQYQSAADINPDSALAYAGMGQALLEMGKPAEGLLAWDQAVRVSPGDWRLLNDFGVRMASSNYFLKAIDYFQQALRINPRAVEARTNLGIVAAKTGHPEEAKKLFEDSLAIDPNFAKAKESLEALNSGRLRAVTTRPATTQSATSSPSSAVQ